MNTSPRVWTNDTLTKNIMIILFVLAVTRIGGSKPCYCFAPDSVTNGHDIVGTKFHSVSTNSEYGRAEMWSYSETSEPSTNDVLTLQYRDSMLGTWTNVVSMNYWGEKSVVTVVTDNKRSGFWRWILEPLFCPPGCTRTNEP